AVARLAGLHPAQPQALPPGRPGGADPPPRRLGGPRGPLALLLRGPFCPAARLRPGDDRPRLGRLAAAANRQRLQHLLPPQRRGPPRPLPRRPARPPHQLALIPLAAPRPLSDTPHPSPLTPDPSS